MITDKIESPHKSGRGGHIPELIVCHICDGTYAGTMAWFENKASVTSAHYIVARDGRVCSCVPLESMAWCNGTTSELGNIRCYDKASSEIVRSRKGNANEYSVSIEFEGYYAATRGALEPAQLESGIKLIQHIREEVSRIYGSEIPLDRTHIVGHSEITPLTRPSCPGELFPWNGLIAGLNEKAERKEIGQMTVREFLSEMREQTVGMSLTFDK